MAISHARPLLLLLLVSLFFLPAALGLINFQNCDVTHRYPIAVKAVFVTPHSRTGSPDISVFATPNINISEGATVVFSIFPHVTKDRSYSLCDVMACPVPRAGLIPLGFKNVFTKSSRGVYLVKVKITKQNQKDPLMCVKFHCGVDPETSLLRQVTE